MHFSYLVKNSPIEISLVATDTQMVEVGEIFSVEVMTHTDCHCLISHEKENNQVTVHASSHERSEMPFIIFLRASQKRGTSASRFPRRSVSEHYQNMLKELSQEVYKNISL